MLTDILPPAARRVVYATFGTIGLVLAAVQAAFLSQHREPVWLVMALAAYGVASAGIHATASSNTPAPKPKRGQAGATTLELAALGILVVVVLILLALLGVF